MISVLQSGEEKHAAAHYVYDAIGIKIDRYLAGAFEKPS